MPEVFKISSEIATPLALAGLFAAVLFFTFRQLLSAKWFPKLGTDAAGDIIKRIVNYLFLLSLVAMVLGFAGFLAQIQPKRLPTSDTNKPPVSGNLPSGTKINAPTNSTSNGLARLPNAPNPARPSPRGDSSSLAGEDHDRTQGAIKVLIEPAEAIEQGAQWKMAQQTVWRPSGTSFEDIRNGTYQVEFIAVAGWLTPSNRAVTIQPPNTNGIVHAAYKRLDDDKPCRDRTEVLHLTFIGNCTWETGHCDFGDCQVTGLSVKGVGSKPRSSSITLERIGKYGHSISGRSASGKDGNWMLNLAGLNCPGLGCASGNYRMKISADRCGETHPTVLAIQLN